MDTDSLLILGFVGFLGAFLNSASGVGGVVMFTFLVGYLPASAAIAVYNLLVALNSTTRVITDHRGISKAPLIRFLVGGVIGVAIAWPFIGVFNGPIFLAGIAAFILLTLWIPKFHLYSLLPFPFSVCGTLQVSLGMMFGTSGPLPMIFLLDSDVDKKRIVPTGGAMQFIGDWTKTIAFMIAGFAYLDYSLLIIVMTAGMLVGTVTGQYVRGRINEQHFKAIVRVLISLIVIRMLVVNLAKYYS